MPSNPPKALPPVASLPTRRERPADPILCFIMILATWSLLFAIRATAPPSILDDDQERPLAYVLDAVVNGNWIVQKDQTGDIMSKPPLTTWLIGVGMALTGSKGLVIPYLVSALAALGTALLIYFGSRRFLGDVTATVAAIVYQLSMMGARQILLIRTDSVFTFLVFGSALAFLAAARGALPWLVFYGLIALSTLTKGPQGVGLSLLVIPGLLVAPSGEGRLRIWSRQHLVGITLYLLVCGGWFLAAWVAEGSAVVDKMIGRELVGHITGAADNKGEWNWWAQPVGFLTQFLPWAPLTLIGLATCWFRPAEERRLLVPMASLFALGMVIFSLVSHQRHLLLMPLFPAAAILAAPLLTQWLRIRPTWKWGVNWLILLLVSGCAFAAYYHVARPYDEKVARTLAAQSLPAALQAKGISAHDLTFVDADYGAQFFLHRMQPRASESLARQALMAPEPFLAVVRGPESKADLAHLPGVQVLLSWPPEPTSKPGWLGFLEPPTDSGRFLVIGNSQEGEGRRLIHPPFSISVNDGTIVHSSQQELQVAPIGNTPPAVTVKNHSARAERYYVWGTVGGSASIRLEPGEKKTVTLSGGVAE